MVTPAARREAVAHLEALFEVSQRRACDVLGVDRTMVRYRSRRSDDGAIRERMRGLAAERRRFGYRRLHWLLGREGVVINHKKFRRLYREERLQVRRRGGRKRALGTRAPMAVPQGRNQRWSLDFVSDGFACGRRFRIFAVVDDFTRECVRLIADTSISGLRVARELDRAIAERSLPAMIVSDNGTELTSMAILRWVEGARGRVALHRARQAAAEWVHRKLQCPPSRRVLERDHLHQPGRGPVSAGRLAARLQPSPAPLELGEHDPGRDGGQSSRQTGLGVNPQPGCHHAHAWASIGPPALLLGGGTSGLRPSRTDGPRPRRWLRQLETSSHPTDSSNAS